MNFRPGHYTKLAVMMWLILGSLGMLQAQDLDHRFKINSSVTEFPAVAFGRGIYTSVGYSKAGTYLYVQSEHDIKLFEAATGRLIYQSNGGKDIPGLEWDAGFKLMDYEMSDEQIHFTGDEAFLQLQTRMRGGRLGYQVVQQFIRLPSGIPVPLGEELSSLQNPDPGKVADRVARNQYLMVKRPYDTKIHPEHQSWLWEMRDPEDSTRTLVFYSQDYLGTKEWRKSLHPDWNKDQFKMEENRLLSKSTRLNYADYHYASLGKVPGDIQYRGIWRKGMMGVDLEKIREIAGVSPDARYAVLALDNGNLSLQKLQLVEISTGKILWSRPGDEFAELLGMNAFGNLYISRRDFASKQRFVNLVDIRTGEFLTADELPYNVARRHMAIGPSNGFVAILHADNNAAPADTKRFGLAIHDAHTGKILMTIADEAAYLDYVNNLKQDYDARAREIEKANSEYALYRQQQAQQEQQKWAKRQAEENALYQQDLLKHANDCPQCNGSGRTATHPSYITKKVLSDGGTYKVVQSQQVYLPRNNATDWQPCSRCNGRGKIK